MGNESKPIHSMFWSDSHCRGAKAVETQTNRFGGGNGCRSSGFCMVLRFRGLAFSASEIKPMAK